MTNIRQSNFELLRLVSMFLILVCHTEFVGLGSPSLSECELRPGLAYSRFMMESLSFVAVNAFVLISGWFGIRPRLEKFLALLFQVFFFSIGTLLVYSAIRGTAISTDNLLKSFMITKCYWFIKSYLCLYILAPVLNAFIESADKRQFLVLILSFFAFQTVYGWSDSAPEFAYGASALSFMGLYLLAAYLRKYPVSFFMNSKLIALAMYFVPSAIIAGIAQIAVSKQIFMEHSLSLIYSYINPLVIMATVGLFAFFAQLRFKSRLINWMAISCFSISIFHEGALWGTFMSTIRRLHNGYSSATSTLLIFGFLILVFMAAILIDQIRKFMWTKTAGLYKSVSGKSTGN